MDLMSLAVNPTKEIEGTEVTPWNDDTVLIVARYNNSPFRAMQARLMEPLVAMAGRDGITTEQSEKVLGKCMAGTILLGWRNLLLDGKEIPYSKEKSRELMLDPRFIDFKEVVMIEAQTLENYRLHNLEEDLGNSEGSLSTVQGGRKSNKNSSKASKKKSRKA